VKAAPKTVTIDPAQPARGLGCAWGVRPAPASALLVLLGLLGLVAVRRRV